MIASSRDVLATVLVGGSAALTWAHVNGLDWPFVGSARTTAGLVFVLGIGACAGGSTESWESDAARKRWYHRAGAALSVVAVGALVWALVTGSTVAVVALASVIGVKWLLATVRHLVTPAPAASAVA
ncbi:hypothetical protein [Demequina phytophila]|uniref:hypothetical protein n=1 Tax=Demequina phytophila TaxID=1638981 RepID=UPI000A8285FE|nr:hypothetical protein [Demequina phytophila]